MNSAGLHTDWLDGLPASVRKLPSVAQVLLVIGVLIALSTIPQTATLAHWLAVIVLLDAILVGLRGK